MMYGIKFCAFCDAEASRKIVWVNDSGVDLATYLCESHFDAFEFGASLDKFDEEEA